MLNIAICDDNEQDLDSIKGMVKEIFGELGQKCRIFTFASPKEMLEGNRINIGILDIVMPGMDGIELGRQLREKFVGIKLIYTSSYEEYYKQVINRVHAFSFLVKPLEKELLKEQIEECLKEAQESAQDKEILFEKVRNSATGERTSLRTSVKNIIYCEYMKSQRKVRIVLENEEFIYSVVFENLVKQLEPYGFAVNCRGSIVNLEHIRKIQGLTIFLDNGERLVLTKKRAAGFRDTMNAYVHAQA